jgi:hypothetical protein
MPFGAPVYHTRSLGEKSGLWYNVTAEDGPFSHRFPTIARGRTTAERPGSEGECILFRDWHFQWGRCVWHTFVTFLLRLDDTSDLCYNQQACEISVILIVFSHLGFVPGQP